PMTAANFNSQSIPDWLQSIVAMLGHGQPLFMFLYGAMIIFFAFFYTAIVFNPEDTADNLKKYGGFIPGIRPGKKTAEYIDRILTRITLVGALYMSVVCVLPTLLFSMADVPFYFGGTALLIVVGVSMDLMAQIEAHLLSRQYEGFVQGTRMRGRLG
ncbi:MAG: preprotein translocase subunit SecY, partial [Pseudomonadota bacterium]